MDDALFDADEPSLAELVQDSREVLFGEIQPGCYCALATGKAQRHRAGSHGCAQVLSPTRDGADKAACSARAVTSLDCHNPFIWRVIHGGRVFTASLSSAVRATSVATSSGDKCARSDPRRCRRALQVSLFTTYRPIGFRHIGATAFSAYTSQCVFGTYRPVDFRPIGASQGV